jgi:hypothetical protein
VFAVAVFALPMGVLASGFDDQIADRREGEGDDDFGGMAAKAEEVVMGNELTFRGQVYNFLHRGT